MKKDKKLNIAQRVEIILREGVEPIEKWIGVQRYELPDYDGSGWDAHESLYEHHLNECEHLRAIIAEMREQILSMDEQLDKKSSKVEA